MHISEELVRELQKRIDVSYEEAEYFLKKTKGDVNMAVYLIMKKRDSSWEKFKTSLWELMKYRFIMTRKGETIINLPLLLIVIFVLLYSIGKNIFPLIVIFAIVLLTECEVRIEKVENGNEHSCHRTQNCSSGNKKQESNTFYEQHSNPDTKQQTTKEWQKQPKQDQDRELKRELKKEQQSKQQPRQQPRQQSKQEQNIILPNVGQEVIKSQQINKPSNNLNEAEDDYYEIVIEE